MRVLEPCVDLPLFRVRQGIGGAPKRTVQGLEPVLVSEDEVGDEEGKFYSGDTVRRVHRGEHTLNVNHPRSQDALAASKTGPALGKLFGGLLSGKNGGMKDLLGSLKDTAIKSLAPAPAA